MEKPFVCDCCGERKEMLERPLVEDCTGFEFICSDCLREINHLTAIYTHDYRGK